MVLLLIVALALSVSLPQPPFFTDNYWSYIRSHAVLVDEPDRIGMSPAELHRLYRHAGHPATVTFVGCSQVPRYVGSFDQALIDWYPFLAGVSDAEGLRSWDRTVKQCVRVMRRLGLPPPIVVVQDFGGTMDGTIWRCVSARLVWAMVAAARELGAGGALLFHAKRATC
jgi:hypothetical protein